MVRIRFVKPCSADGRTWQPGDEGDFEVDLAEEIRGLDAGEIIGPSASDHPPPATNKKSKKSRTSLP